MDKKKEEAATLQRKKSTVTKSKMKKTIKNTLCRPDPVFWPTVTDEQAKELETILATHKVEIPEFKKPHWKDINSMPKEQRPKQPKIKKVDGLIFGIAECTEALKNNQCSAVIIESTVNPQQIVQPLIEACISNQVPVVCLNGLRKITSSNFGIPTTCLAVKTGFLQELGSKVKEISKLVKHPKLFTKKVDGIKIEIEEIQNKMETDNQDILSTSTNFTYLYRSNKNTRMFNPSQEGPKAKKAFFGQDFIEFSEKPKQKPDSKAYMSMILKKLTNNENRTKRK